MWLKSQPLLVKIQMRNHILTVALAIILASIVYSGILLKTNLKILKNNNTSTVIQQINVQELSISLGNIQLNINRYILSHSKSSQDSFKRYKKEFELQSGKLYKISSEIPELKKQATVIYFNFPEIVRQVEQRMQKLPNKITAQNAANIFGANGDPFSDIWKAIYKVRLYQLKFIQKSTKENIASSSWSWKVSVFGSIFMLAIVVWGYIYISISYKRQERAEAKELASEMLRKENEKLLQAVMDNCTSIIFIKDKNQRYTLVNKRFKQLVDLENEDIIGKTQNELFEKTDQEQINTAEDRILSFGEIKESTETVRIKNRTQYYLTTKFPLIGEAGEVIGLGGISTDITHQTEHENELNKARELAEAAKISQQLFLANMSHEIRTPMNGVIGMTNLLDSTSLTTEQEDYVNVIRQSSNILMLLINDILDVSKMQAGMLKLEKIPFEVRESVKQIFLSYKLLADEMGTHLKSEVDPATPEFLLGDPLRLNQIISNLVNNAIKFTSSGSISIKVSGEEKENKVFNLQIAVIDTGIGIPADKLEDVFNSFTQSSISTTRKYGGTGLGLAIVKELVEMQGGTVSLVSELNVGSTFTVTIPFQIDTTDKIQQQKSKGKQNFTSLKDKKILVVEDNLINQKVARQILLKAGFKVVSVADNGYKALEMLQTETFDAVLMDVQMPDMDGIETTRHIRNDLKLSIPVVALTASALPEDREICFKAGMNEYVTKPFLPEDLLQKLSALI